MRTSVKLLFLLVVGLWLPQATSMDAYLGHSNDGAAARRTECDDTSDCLPERNVCVSGECVSCVEDPGQCDWYEIYSNLVDPFCESTSGDCWECSDCWMVFALGCNPDQNACTPCNESGAYCGPTQYCDDGYCIWIPEAAECSLTEASLPR